MKLILFAAVALTFSLPFIARADDAKTQATTPVKAKALDDGNDNDGDGAATESGQTDGGQKVAPGRAPTGASGDFPYSEEEMRQADPGYNNSTKNMPVDQD